MANPEHLEILKQGVQVWNEWRIKKPETSPDLYGADISKLHLPPPESALDKQENKSTRFFLEGFGFEKSDNSYLSGVNFRATFLQSVILTGVTLNGADLTGANLNEAKLNGANLNKAKLRKAMSRSADLTQANLEGADLTEADFYSTNFTGTKLETTDFNRSKIGRCVFTDVDLSSAINLEMINHSSPSEISVSTLYKSVGKIPAAFLRGCGLSDWQIEYTKLHQPELSNEEVTNILYRVHDLRAHQAIQISPLFISYSHTDGAFVDAVETSLSGIGVRFWRDVHHSTAGRLERQIDRAIRLNPTVLLVLSEHSVRSDWVEHEARLARKLEQEMGRDVLCPVALDNSWKTCWWPERLREQIMEYNVLDFSNWQDSDDMRRMFSRLIEGLGLFYK
jgi:uncharacterized protein YjbI with pentapeptide repeats